MHGSDKPLDRECHSVRSRNSSEPDNVSPPALCCQDCCHCILCAHWRDEISSLAGGISQPAPRTQCSQPVETVSRDEAV